MIPSLSSDAQVKKRVLVAITTELSGLAIQSLPQRRKRVGEIGPLIKQCLQLMDERGDGHASHFTRQNRLFHGKQGCSQCLYTMIPKFAARLEPFPSCWYLHDQPSPIELCIHKGEQFMKSFVERCHGQYSIGRRIL